MSTPTLSIEGAETLISGSLFEDRVDAGRTAG